MIWNWQSSHTNCMFRILVEVGAELKVSILDLLTLHLLRSVTSDYLLL